MAVNLNRKRYYRSMKSAVDYIERNINERVTVAQAAGAACISKDHFWRLFKQIFRETVGCYIRKRKLTIISRKLLSTKKATAALAIEYGFESREAFSRSFKKVFGTTPAVYRKNRRIIIDRERHRLTESEIRRILAGGTPPGSGKKRC
jgi:AraC family transcriptional regulator